MLPNCHPVPNVAIRFVTGGSISLDVKEHGIDGYWDGAKYWSSDGADHWESHEVKAWRYKR